MANLKRIDKAAEHYADALNRVLKSRRENAAMTMTLLAEESGVSQQMISLLEKGERVPSITSIFRLAHGLGTTPLDIIREAEETLSLRLPVKKRK